MHDAAPAFDYTVFVEDQDEPIAISRAASDWERTMQAYVMGAWHRRKPNLSKTACGVPYHANFAPLRREELRNPLCSVCFCEDERNDADDLDRQEREGTLP